MKKILFITSALIFSSLNSQANNTNVSATKPLNQTISEEKQLLDVAMNSLFKHYGSFIKTDSKSGNKFAVLVNKEVTQYIYSKYPQLNVKNNINESHFVSALVFNLFFQIAIRETLVGDINNLDTALFASRVALTADYNAFEFQFYTVQKNQLLKLNDKLVSNAGKDFSNYLSSSLSINTRNFDESNLPISEFKIKMLEYYKTQLYNDFAPNSYFEFSPNKIELFNCKAKNGLVIQDVFAIMDNYMKDFNILMYTIFKIKLNFPEFAFRNIGQQNFEVVTTCIDQNKNKKHIINSYTSDGRVTTRLTKTP